MNTREVTHQYRLNQWTEKILECRNSGQTIANWCAEHNVNIKSYYYWLKRVRLAACEALPALNCANQQFVPVKFQSNSIVSKMPTQETSAAIVLHLGSVIVELNNEASQTLIENTLKALQNVR